MRWMGLLVTLLVQVILLGLVIWIDQPLLSALFVVWTFAGLALWLQRQSPLS
ncbi:MAG: hypothetical protein HC915_14430 [Anaerolineae bacterium]|nr:hypothetical protein [Anaerolineae bacterium]